MAGKIDDVALLRSAAEVLGWSEQPRGKGGCVLLAPKPHVARIVLPPRGPLRQSIRSSNTRKLVRYAEPMARVCFFGRFPELTAGVDFSDIAPLPIQPEPKVRPTEEEPVTAAAEIDTGEVIPDRTAVELVIHDQLTLVSAAPWMAHKSPSTNGGTRYQSQAVIEQHWSDGSVDYACAMDSCDFHDGNPRAVANHFGSRNDHRGPRDQKDVERDRVLDREYVEPLSRRQIDRLNRWRKRLDAAMDGLDRGASDFVERLAERMVEQAGESTSDGSGEPLTAEQILERVRRLVDNGSYLAAQEQAQNMEIRISALEQDLHRAQSGIAESEARAARYKQRWDEYRDRVLDDLAAADED